VARRESEREARERERERERLRGREGKKGQVKMIHPQSPPVTSFLHQAPPPNSPFSMHSWMD
jgi:hypothetical protein